MPDDNPICLVTGATGGLGTAAADGLAGRQATVVMVCRDAGRGETARAKVSAASRNSRIDLVLVNAAAVFTRRRRMTADGFELMFATNI